MSANVNLYDFRHSIVLGEHTKGVDPDCHKHTRRPFCAPRIQTIPVESFVIHAGYSKNTKENDIALIRLASEADTSQGNIRNKFKKKRFLNKPFYSKR